MTFKIYFDAASLLPDLQIREAKRQWLCSAQRVPSGPAHQRDSCSKHAPFLPQQWPLPGIISGEGNLALEKLHDRSQEISVLCLFLFWQAIYCNPKSDFKSYNWLHPPQLLADGTHPALQHLRTPFSPTGAFMNTSGCSHPLTFSFVRAGVLASCSPRQSLAHRVCSNMLVSWRQNKGWPLWWYREGLVRESVTLVMCDSHRFILPTLGNGNSCVETNLLPLSPEHYSDPTNQPLDTWPPWPLQGPANASSKSNQSKCGSPYPPSLLPPCRKIGGTRSVWHCRRPVSNYASS